MSTSAACALARCRSARYTAHQLATLRELAASLGATANQVVIAWMLDALRSPAE